jgi:hypothetical protein
METDSILRDIDPPDDYRKQLKENFPEKDF